MTPDNLDALSDAQLSEAFAYEVAQCERIEGEWIQQTANTWKHIALPAFATDANSVLPYVQAFLNDALYSQRLAFWRNFQTCGTLESGNTPHWPDCLGLAIRDGKLARYFCLALIRARRAAR